MIQIKVINKGHQQLPAYATSQSAGMDLRANLEASVVLKLTERKLVSTGPFIALPEGFEIQVRPRNGLTLKHGITVLNTLDTIDAGYRGEVMVLLVDFSQEELVIRDGERIAQMAIARHEQGHLVEVEELDETERGTGGYGHTGVKQASVNMMKQNLKISLNHILRCLPVGWMLMSLALPAWAQEPEDKPLTEADLKKMLFEDKQSQYHCLSLEAVSQLNADKLELVDNLLHQCLTLRPQGAEIYYAQGRLLAQQKKDTLTLEKFEKAAALQPENSHYQERVTQYYIGTDAFGKAIVAYERLYENNHQRTDMLSILGQLYNQQKNYDKMLSVLERIEQVEGTNEELTFSRMSVYEMMGNKESACKTLQQLADSHPNDVNYKVMLGNWLMQHGGQKKAYKLFIQALEEEPNNGFVLTSLYDHHNQVGDKEKAIALRDRILMSKDTEIQIKMTMLQQVIQGNEDHKGDSTEMLNLFRRVMKVHPKDADIAPLAAAYMSLKKMPQDTVIAALQHVIDIAPDNSPARSQLLRVYLPGKSWKKIITLCEEGVQFTPDEMVYYYYMAWAHVQQDEQPKVIDTLKRGVSTINDKSDIESVSESYSMMGDLLHQQGDQQGVSVTYDSCLQWRDNNIACSNNYAYSLSEDGQNLKRTEQVSYKAVTASPNNATYLDIYTWILFMQERYTEAELYTDQALKNNTDSVQSVVIIEHAGDIYVMNGNIDRALKYRQETLKLALKDDQALIERKIKQKKYTKK